MKWKLLYSICIFAAYCGAAQTTKFEVLPFADLTTSIKDGQIEVGPELNWENTEKQSTLKLRPTIRLPLTDKSDNVLQIDRFSSTWRGVLAAEYTKRNAPDNGYISIHAFTGQFEYGWSDYTYYPLGNKSNEQTNNEGSYAFEVKYVGFFTEGKEFAKQISPQFRLRYAHEWNSASEVGVVNPANSDNVVTTSNLILEPPKVYSTLSPAFSLQMYSGKSSFSYSPTIYYDIKGKEGTSNPFGNVNRLRLETWIFFYPLVKGNVKIGASPFLSLRTAGIDDFNKAEYGGMIAIKFGTTFLQFL